MLDYEELHMNAGNEMGDRLSKVAKMPRKGMKITQILRFWYTFLVQLEMDIM